MTQPTIAILHYTAPPVVGGVEAVIEAHLRVLIDAGYPAHLISGRGDRRVLPETVHFYRIGEIDSRHPRVIAASRTLEVGEIPPDFEAATEALKMQLSPVLQNVDYLIVHNVFTKHFNLPLSTALHQLLDEKRSLVASPGVMISPGPARARDRRCTPGIHGTCCGQSART